MTIGAQTAIPSRGNERLCFASNSSFRSGEPFQFMNRPQCLAEAQNLRLTKEAPAYVVSCYYAVVAPGRIIGHGKPEATTLRTLFSKLAGFLLKSFSLIFSNMAYEPSTSRFLYRGSFGARIRKSRHAFRSTSNRSFHLKYNLCPTDISRI